MHKVILHHSDIQNKVVSNDSQEANDLIKIFVMLIYFAL